jgi:hypothetical protein
VAPTLGFFFILSISSCRASGEKSTSPSSAMTYVFSAYIVRHIQIIKNLKTKRQKIWFQISHCELNCCSVFDFLHSVLWNIVCRFSFGDYIVCASHRFTASDYTIGIREKSTSPSSAMTYVFSAYIVRHIQIIKNLKTKDRI